MNLSGKKKGAPAPAKESPVPSNSRVAANVAVLITLSLGLVLLTQNNRPFGLLFPLRLISHQGKGRAPRR
jgi:hypothetical protein